VEGLKNSLGFDNSFAISSNGHSGGLGIFWNNDIKVDLLWYSQYHIDVILTEGANDPWRLTCVYGEAQMSERHKDLGLVEICEIGISFTMGLYGRFQ
jgi:hypothetical protein